MIIVLLIILMLLMFLIGGDRGVVSFVTLCANFIFMLVAILLMYWGINAIAVTYICCILISLVTLFYQNGENAKTFSAFISIFIIITLLSFFAYKMGYAANLQGFSTEKQLEDEMSGLSVNMNIDMIKIAFAVIMIGLIGAVLDMSIAISSSVYEVYKNNNHLTQKDLFLSGINIGSDIIGSTTNTLFFAFLAEFLMLMIRFKKEHYSFDKIINSKAFSQEMIPIIFSCIGCILIIPICSVIISYVLTHKSTFHKWLKEDPIFQND
ncbi:YibE/F family protein [Anaeromicropila herbilytica]|uniref:YibE/F family protein n=1 Tax=Anaeromicropila herbilytica TaxID=2785025 RepID=A0A7R7ELZ8_9FIRM|nr:YibE/F family protein [Anaeromicropila herbilytica]BCN31284.1 YibE/F family protein [Anaeromicropila herbilytica]